MPRNVEIKARVIDWEQMRQRAAAIADGPPATLEQEDMYLHRPARPTKTPNAKRLSRTHLLFPRKHDAAQGENPAIFASRSRIQPPRKMLALVHGERGIIRKTRWLYLAGQTRIHLDPGWRRLSGISGTGKVVMRDGQSIEEGDGYSPREFDGTPEHWQG